MSKHDADQKGPQQHAEGQQGKKTHDAFIDGLHGRHGGSPESEGVPQDNRHEREHQDGAVSASTSDGRHRLFEDRQQHDEADKNSEKNRLARELDRGRTSVQDDSVNGDMRT